MPIEITNGLHILNSETVSSGNNSVLVQLGNNLTGDVSNINAEIVQHVGFASVAPLAVPNSAQASEAIVISDSCRDLVIGSRDLRTQQMYGSLKPGETAMFGGGSDGNAQGRVIIKQDGSINLYTRQGNTQSGGGMGVFISPGTDQISAINSKGYGIVINDSQATMTMGGTTSCVNLDNQGNVSVIGTKQTQVDGGVVMLGSQATAGINTVVINPAALVEVLSSIAACLGAFTGTGTFPGLAALTTQLTTLTAQISSQKVIAQ